MKNCIYYVSSVFLTEMEFFFRVPGISPGELAVKIPLQCWVFNKDFDCLHSWSVQRLSH